jgi:hypothetical protein
MTILRKFSEFIGRLSHRGLFVRLLGFVCIAWLPSQVLAEGVATLFGLPRHDPLFASPRHVILGGLLLAPMLETLGMKYMFRLGRKWIRDDVFLNVLCALAWGVMHIHAPGFGIHATWAFFVFGACFQEISRTKNENAAFVNVAAIHAFFNALAYGAFLLVR